MKPENRKDFANLLADVMDYYGKPCPAFVMDVWWQACQGYTIEQVGKALTAHATDPERGQFAPKVADLVRVLAGTHTDRALLAWGKVHEAMSSVGAYTDVVFDDPAIHAAIDDIGGWPKICRTDIKELSYLQHRFCESHKAYTGRGSFDYPRRLIGDRSPDAMYERRGMKVPAPALIGDKDRCKAVYAAGNIGGKIAISFNAHDLVSSIPRLVDQNKAAA